MHVSEVKELGYPQPMENADLKEIAARIVAARKRGAAVILMMGAHVIKTGMSRFIIDLMEKGLVTHVGFNGACAIHDFELAMIGATTESVARYISAGQFGLWQETGQDQRHRQSRCGKGLWFWLCPG